jgi:prevent-host-death family protein
MEVTATEIKNNFGYYLDQVTSKDQDVVITKNGKKVARLTPYITDVERYFTVRENALDYQYGGKKVSYDEFMEIYETSSLRMELINGEIYILQSPSVTHQEILIQLLIHFSERFKNKPCKPFIAPVDVHFKKAGIKDMDVMQPDLFVACDLETTVNEKDRYMGTPTLVLEILSESTRKKDMLEKLNTYMLSGVNEYWVIDPKYQKALIYEFKDNNIEQYTTVEQNGTIKSYYLEGLEVELVKIFN